MTHSADEHAALIRRHIDGTFNRRDWTVAAAVHGDDYRYYDVTTADEGEDHDTYLARTEVFLSAFPDAAVVLEDLVAAGDRVAIRVAMRGTHTAPLGELPPSGRPIHLMSMTMYRFADGRVSEEWELFDKLGLYQQLGVSPPQVDQW
jgi:steroid delta-isomerase-like uncharacterized protein